MTVPVDGDPTSDPNGVTYDPHTGLYHRFYQYDPTYSDTKCHATGTPRTWGQTVSRDLATWEVQR